METLVGELSSAVTRQAEAMRHLAELTADSLRAATGAYVFQLRDRFDESLPAPQFGVVEGGWAGVDGTTDEAASEPIEALVLHPGDLVRLRWRVLCNQTIVRRVIEVRTEPLDGSGQWRPARFSVSETRDGDGERYDLAANTSLFVELAVDVPVDKLDLGPYEQICRATIEVSDNRPEGAVASFAVTARARGIVVPDDDGIGIEAATVEVMIGNELRAYYLDKPTQLPLSLPVRLR